MLKRITLLIIISLMLTACYKYNSPKKPENLISKEEMVNILIDLRLMLSISGKNQKILDANKVAGAQYVYKKHNIDSLKFALSNDYYSFYINDYDDIYTKIKDSLETLKLVYINLVEKEAKEKKKADSLKHAK